MNLTSSDTTAYVNEVQAISAVPQILETVAAITGLGFVAVAHVTENSWTTCAVRDQLGFGLKVGDGLDVTTTLCEEVRSSGKTIVIDHVQESEQYCTHHTPRIYGFQSYFSAPIFRRDGTYFGTLCGLDPNPKTLSSPSTVSTLELFAELISRQLESERHHAATQASLQLERETAELREQFVALLGHDLRTPLSAFQNGLDLLRLKHTDPDALPLIRRMQRSVARMSAMVDDVVDFTRGRMGGGISLNLRHENALELPLGHVIDELRELHPKRVITAHVQPGISLLCDIGRLSQLLSNLLKNAILHGRADTPITVSVSSSDGEFAIAVRNQGDPLSPQFIQQLFKPFWRGQSRTAHEGLGLGLYIVSQIAMSHGGKMDVTSHDGTICFKFSLTDQSPGARPVTS